MKNSKKWIEKKCKWCNESFSARISDIKRGYGYLCSRRCQALWRWHSNKAEKSAFNKKAEYIKKKCLHCKKLFNLSSRDYKKGTHTGKYCSVQCYRLSRPMTEPELIMSKIINESGYSFRREFPIKTKSKYQKYKYVDFFIHELNLAVEVHGEYWHTLPGAAAKDKRKESAILNANHELIIVWENDLLFNKDGVTSLFLEIASKCESIQRDKEDNELFVYQS